MPTIGYAVLQIIPSLKGVSAAIDKEMRGTTVKVTADEQAARRSGQRAGKALSDGVGEAATGVRGAINNMVSGITSGFGSAGKSVDSLFQSIPTKAALGAGAVLGVGAAAVTVGKQLYDLGEQWDSVVDSAAGRTGLLGDNLKALTGSIKEVANTTASSIPEIGDIASRVSQSLHLTGKPLEEMTKSIADLNALTGEQTNVRELGKAYRAFGVDVGDQVSQLDALWNAATATGIPINELIATIDQGAPALKAFGLNLGESAGLVATFEDAGVNANSAITSLRIALKNFADEGKEPQQALRDTITEIKNLADAGNIAAATDLAAKTFGRGFAEMFEAIRSGKLDVDALNNSLRQTGSTAANSISQARAETSDWSEQLQILKNNLSTSLEPAASATFGGINVLLEQYVLRPFREANDLVTKFRNLMNGLPSGPSGPAVLGPGGTQMSAPAPPPAGNPLGAITGAPPSTRTPSGPRNPLDELFPTHRATGGGIFGPGGPKSDIIPIWASNGEHILSAKDVQAMGGQAGVYAFRNALHRAEGGAVGGMTVDQLKQFASGIAGHAYVWGGGNGDTFATDCSGAQSTIANFITGGKGRFATSTESGALLSRGFKLGDPPSGVAAYWVGWLNGGPGGGHTAGTIVDPVGGNTNVEMGGRAGNGQFGGTAAGAAGFPNRAWIAIGAGDDPTKNTFSGGSSPFAGGSAVAAATSGGAAVAPSSSGSSSGSSGGVGSSFKFPSSFSELAGLALAGMGITTKATPNSPERTLELGNIAAGAVGGQVDSLLDVFGVNGSPGWLQGISTLISGIRIGGGDGAALPLSATSTATGVPGAAENMHQGTGQQPGPGVTYNITARDTEDAFIKAQRLEREKAAAKLSRF